MSRTRKAGKPRREAEATGEIEARKTPEHNGIEVPLVCILLAIATLFVFRQTGGFDFVNYDDDTNVYLNRTVKEGLTFSGIHRAFAHTQIGHWVPLTGMSHMLDCQLHGLNAGGHHLTNVVLHTISAILLFLVLRKMTSSLWPSAFVAAVFAVHPLRVESVAWVTERKDVLSGLFFMLTIGAYVRYARNPWSPSRYLSVLVLFALGLMSKSMLVTLPFVLLLLDYWPLHRFGMRAAPVPGSNPHDNRVPLSRLIAEKLPLLALSVAVSLVTLAAGTKGIVPFEKLPLFPRVGNALVSYVTYICQMFYPVNLAVFYPHPRGDLPIWQIIGAIVLLLGVSAIAVALRRRQPWFLVGWLWYLGMLVPVIGIVQSGDLARADRYTYLPQIGLYLLVTWTVTDSGYFSRWRHRGMGVAASIIIVILAVCSRKQTSYWEDSESLWKHAISCTPADALPHHNLGAFLAAQGRIDEAQAEFQKALRLQPNSSDALNNLGNLLARNGHAAEAIQHFQAALQLLPNDRRLIKNLGAAYLHAERADEAIAQFRKALAGEPDSDEIHTNLGLALEKAGNPSEAIAHYERALEIDRNATTPRVNLAWILATCTDASLRNGRRAIELALQAIAFSGGKEPIILDTLAAAYAEDGQFPKAVETDERALQLANENGNPALADAIHARLNLYRENSPFRDVPKKGAQNH